MNGWTFGIITDGEEPGKTTRVIASIKALNIDASEILIAGKPVNMWAGAARLIRCPWLADGGRLGAMRNICCANATYDHLCIVDDDIIFDGGWYQAMQDYGDDWDVLSCRILNPDGTRFWDWKTYYNGINKLLDYDKTSPHISITGGYIAMKRYVHDKVRWDDERGFYQAEDVDFCERLKLAGYRIGINTAAVVTHDAGYTQRGDYIYRVGA